MDLPLEKTIGNEVDERLIEFLSGSEVLAIAQSSMPVYLEVELEHRLYLNRETEISAEDKRRLDELLEMNFEMKTRRAKAIRIAMERGLIFSTGTEQVA